MDRPARADPCGAMDCYTPPVPPQNHALQTYDLTPDIAILLTLVAVTSASAQNAGPSQLESPFYSGITDPASLEQAVQQRVARADGLLQQVLSVKGPRTAANTLQPYDRMSSELDAAGSLAAVMARLHPAEGMRSAAE